MPAPGVHWLSSREASARLGVKLATLYAYTSRGLIASLPGDGQRARRYSSDDVERLRTRHAARSGHAPVAAAALRFGEPVLETSICEVTADGPRYRGALAIDLARNGESFEAVAERLWQGTGDDHRSLELGASSREVTRCWSLIAGRPALPKLALLLSALALGDEHRHAASDAAERTRARALLHWLASAPAPHPPARSKPKQAVAATLLDALGVPQTKARIAGVNAGLVLSAEHELNASAFAARVAASAGADLYACLGAAVNTLSGSAHGGMCDRVEALLDGIGKPEHAARNLSLALERGELVPGFGHALYPNGDPRGALLLELARATRTPGRTARTAFALVDAMAHGGHPAATLDAGLVTLCACLRLPRGSAALIFALGRSAGWVAHVIEQRAAGYLLRPRARYVGTP